MKISISILLGLVLCGEPHPRGGRSFDEQINNLLSRIKLSDQKIDAYLNITKDVESSLQGQWPGCTVNAIGSIITDLALQRSDLDMNLNLPANVNVSYELRVSQTKEQLEKYPHLFKNLTVTSTKTPRVTFVSHTGVPCDLNFRGRNTLINNDLIKYFMDLDERTHKLVLVIKFWSKVHRIREKVKMKSFQTVFLVIFYLQQLKILPSVQYLQEGAKTDEYNYWNYGFTPQPYLHYDNFSLYQLLGGFFKYYSKFDFDKYVVSPFIGFPVERELFQTPKKLPDGFVLYKHNIEHGLGPLNLNHLVIQDSFEHNVNVDEAVGNRRELTLRFRDHLINAASKFERSSEFDFLTDILIDGSQSESEMSTLRTHEYASEL